MAQGNQESLYPSNPLGRLGTTQDVANSAVFLVSEETQFITGKTIAPLEHIRSWNAYSANCQVLSTILLIFVFYWEINCWFSPSVLVYRYKENYVEKGNKLYKQD